MEFSREQLIACMAAGFVLSRMDIITWMSGTEKIADQIDDVMSDHRPVFEAMLERLVESFGGGMVCTLNRSEPRRENPPDRDPWQEPSSIARSVAELVLTSSGQQHVQEGDPGWEDAPLKYLFNIQPTRASNLLILSSFPGRKDSLLVAPYLLGLLEARTEKDSRSIMVSDLLEISANEILSVDKIGPSRLRVILDTLRGLELDAGGQ